MSKQSVTDREALLFHSQGRPGKIEIVATKPLATQRDLSLAYSPGVAAPVLAIAEDPNTAYDYTAKGNLVAVISNGTAILGLGDLGALASKPVMEGKSVLFKRFADVDSIDLEVDTNDVDTFVNCVRVLEPSFGGINLEDIKAPECFIIEQRLRELMKIPVFHDDQHGTAIVTAAGLLNALDLSGQSIKTVKLVVNGAGAAAIACLELIKAMGLPHNNAIMCDTKGVIYQGRAEGMNQWKSAHAVDTRARTLAEAMEGANVFLGLSSKGAVTQDMVRSMAKNPIIFACANPDPEITPEEVEAVRSDAIIATGRSDYPNQVNNVLGFPYIFRGALDVRATTITEEMKIAAARALAGLAREDVPDEVASAYATRPKYGPKYIIPAPFDPRLITHIPVSVALAAMADGVARRPIVDIDAYQRELRTRLNPTAGVLDTLFDQLRARPRRVVFAEGHDERMLRAAVAFRSEGFGTPVLVGREDEVQETVGKIGIDLPEPLERHHGTTDERTRDYIDFLYGRLQRRGYLRRDIARMVQNDRNVFAACMVAMGDADAMVTGVTRNYTDAMAALQLVLDPKPGCQLFGLSAFIGRGRIVFIADTTVHEFPEPEQMADMAIQSAAVARAWGHEPRVAFLSFSTFGNPPQLRAVSIKEGVRALEKRRVDFEFDGEMAADVALNPELAKLYPFSRLTGPANVLIMPALHSANIGSKLLQELGGGRLIGPILVGLEKPAQIVPMGAGTGDILTMAALAAHDVERG